MAGTGSRSAYVGRELELDRLGRRLEAAAEGRGGVVVVRGPSGMGTTRTASELAGRADRLGMVALWGQTVDGLSGRPFGAIADALEELGTSQTPAELRAQLLGGASALARLCPRLREVLPDIAPAAPLEAVDERLRLYDAVAGWLRRASADRPILLVLDDWQWADEDSRRLLDHICRFAPSLPLLIMLTEAFAPSAEDRPSVADAEVVELAGLDEGAIGAILGEITDRPVSAATVTAIHEVSQGHPLFARELFLHLREADQLAGGSTAAEELPATYEAVIAWRLSRLPLDTRTVLNALACFPHGVGAGLLTEVTGMARSRLIDVVERAVSSGLVRPTELGQHYELYHDRLRLALVAAIPGRVRAAVHRRAAESREADLGEDARAHAAELVDHFVAASVIEPAAGADPRAVRHLLVAAEQARAAYSHRRAAGLLGHAVTALGEGRQTDYVDLAARRAIAEAEAGSTDVAVAGVRELITGQRRHGSLMRETWSDIVTTVRTIRYAGEVDAAANLARMASDEGAPRDEMVRRRLKLLSEQWQPIDAGGVSSLVWRTDESDAAATLLERGDEADQLDVFLFQRPRNPAESGQLTVAVASWHRPATSLRGMRAASSDLIGRLGQFRAGAAMAGRYLAAAERYGSLRDVASALLLLARARAALGELPPAAEIVQASDEVIARIPEPGELSLERLQAALTLAHYTDGDWPDLIDSIVAAIGAGASPVGLELAGELAVANARASREAEARAAIPSLLEAASRIPPLTWGRDAALFLALTATWEVGAAEHAQVARQLLEKSVAVGAGGGHTATPRLALARLHALAGNVPEARDDFAKERARLDGAGIRPLRAIVDYDEAVAIGAAGRGLSDAETLLDQAFRQFQGLGMPGWARRVEIIQASGFEAAAQPGGRLFFSYPAGLSRREVDIVRLLAAGQTTEEAAGALDLDKGVVEGHLAAALEKFGAANLDELPRFARRYGLGGT